MKISGTLTRITGQSAAPQAAPILAVSQAQAAVVSPRTSQPLCAHGHAGAEKTDPGDKALHHAAHGARVALRHHGNGGAETHQSRRADTGRLVVEVAIEPERDAGQRGGPQTNGDLPGVHGGRLAHLAMPRTGAPVRNRGPACGVELHS